MDDNIGKIIAAFLGVILLFFTPLLCITLQMENTSQAYIDRAVVEFVDNARATGIITDDSYEKLCREIDTAQMCCEIRIEHCSKYVAPGEDDKPTVYYFNNQKADILDYIYPDAGSTKVYEMKNGDFLKVVVVNQTPTLATKLYRMIMPQYNSSGVSIYACYSGYVGNNPE